MEQRARSLAKPRAVEDIVDLLEKLAKPKNSDGHEGTARP
jgi:hypothetical protein